MEREKLLTLYGAIGAWLHLDDAESEETARKIVGELFPPAAKPLVWVNSLKITNMPAIEAGDYLVSASGCVYFRSEETPFFMAESEYRLIFNCKAAAEAHSQARFLEQ